MIDLLLTHFPLSVLSHPGGFSLPGSLTTPWCMAHGSFCLPVVKEAVMGNDSLDMRRASLLPYAIWNLR